MSWLIQSRRRGRKRWRSHIPSFFSKESAVRRIADWRWYGKAAADQEFRVVQRENGTTQVAWEEEGAS